MYTKSITFQFWYSLSLEILPPLTNFKKVIRKLYACTLCIIYCTELYQIMYLDIIIKIDVNALWLFIIKLRLDIDNRVRNIEEG